MRSNGGGEEECKRNAYGFVREWELQQRQASEGHCGFMFGTTEYCKTEGQREGGEICSLNGHFEF